MLYKRHKFLLSLLLPLAAAISLILSSMGAATASLVLSALAVILLSFLLRVLICLLWKPYAITQYFKKQGVDGPGYKFFKGSNEDIKAMKREASGLTLDTRSHDVASRVIPHYIKWASQYGLFILIYFNLQRQFRIAINIQGVVLPRQAMCSSSGLGQIPGC